MESDTAATRSTKGGRGVARLLAVLLVAAVAASAGVAFGAGAHTSTVVTAAVSSSGRYVVAVKLRTRNTASELVTLYVAGVRARRIRAFGTRTVHASFTVNLGQGSLLVRAATQGPPVRLSVSLTKLGGLMAGPLPAAPGTTVVQQPSSGATTVTGSGGGAAPAPPPPVPTTAVLPPPGSPYQNVVWSDDFVADYNGGLIEPNPAYWTFDTWGGCGTGTQSVNTSASANVHLTPQGLAITAIKNGSGGGYTSAQLDSGGHFSFPNGAYVAASIALPSGQGLCPAFWMLADQPATGTSFPGEIDTLEAPSFVGANEPASVGNPMFVVHGPVNGVDQQEWIRGGSPRPWNPTQFNTYGVQWTGTSITWYVNNVALATFSQSDVPAGGSWSSFMTTFHLLLDLAVGGWPGQSSVASATMYVQWVKVFA